MKTIVRGILIGLCAITATVALCAQQMPKSTTQKIAGASTSKTEQLHGTVLQVEDNHLLVRMSTGDVRAFDVPESRRFVIDGNEVTVHDLKPGTKLTATVTTTTTPVTERTTTVGTGKVFYVAGTTVILTLPNNENRMYKVKDSYKFMVDGRPATVFDLRKGMIVSAEKIVEEPKTELATNIAVTGTAPAAPKPVVAETPAARPAPRPAPKPVETAERTAPPVEPTPAPAEAPKPPAKLPKTGSPVPLIGMLGLLFTGASMGLRKLRSF